MRKDIIMLPTSKFPLLDDNQQKYAQEGFTPMGKHSGNPTEEHPYAPPLLPTPFSYYYPYLPNYNFPLSYPYNQPMNGYPPYYYNPYLSNRMYPAANPYVFFVPRPYDNYISRRIPIQINGDPKNPEPGLDAQTPISSKIEAHSADTRRSSGLSISSQPYASNSSEVQNVNMKNFLENSIHLKNKNPSPSEEDVEVKSHVSDKSDLNYGKVKNLFHDYFYCKSNFRSLDDFTTRELKIIKLMLIKKLIHDKNRSKLYLQIVELKSEEVHDFMRMHLPINRKNIIKMSIFIKIWHILEEKLGIAFYNHYFGDLFDKDPTIFILQRNLKVNKYKITDHFYTECFLSKKFEKDFFEVLGQANFREETLKHSQKKFATNFVYWVNKLKMFIQDKKDCFSQNLKIPELKFGISEADLEVSNKLFVKVIRNSSKSVLFS